MKTILAICALALFGCAEYTQPTQSTVEVYRAPEVYTETTPVVADPYYYDPLLNQPWAGWEIDTGGYWGSGHHWHGRHWNHGGHWGGHHGHGGHGHWRH